MTNRVNEPASWLDHHDVFNATDAWYSGCYGHPHCNGLVPHRFGTTNVVWCVMEHGLIVPATLLAEKQNMNLHPGALAVGIAQLDDRERFRTKYWSRNVSGMNVNVLRMGFCLPTQDNCGYSKYLCVRMCIRPWTTHVHKIQGPQPPAGETTR